MDDPIGDRDTVVNSADLRCDNESFMAEFVLTPGQIGNHHLDPANTWEKSGGEVTNSHTGMLLTPGFRFQTESTGAAPIQ